jgi:hypothetical protein
MPKKDIRVTRALHDAKLFEHHDSYVDTDGHLILRGADKSRIRPLIFRKFRSKCCICGHKLHEEALPFDQFCGAWHHPGPCSCVGCTDLRCDITTGRPCHAHRTAGAGFDRKRQAAVDFARVNPEDL